MKDLIQQCSVNVAGPFVNLNFKFTNPMTPSGDMHTNMPQLWAVEHLIKRMQEQGVLEAKPFHIVLSNTLTLTEHDVKSAEMAPAETPHHGVRADFGLQSLFSKKETATVPLRSSEGLELILTGVESTSEAVSSVRNFLKTQDIPMQHDTPRPSL